jgi:hypothetical protein
MPLVGLLVGLAIAFGFTRGSQRGSQCQRVAKSVPVLQALPRNTDSNPTITIAMSATFTIAREELESLLRGVMLTAA